MKLKDIKIRDYLLLENRSRYDIYESYVKPKKMGRDFSSLSFDEVAVLKRMAISGDLDSLRVISQIFFRRDLEDLWLFDFFGFKKWFEIELNKRIEREQVLESAPDAKLIQAGIDRLNIFAEANTKKTLGEQFGYKPSDIGKWKYDEVFRIMHQNKITGEITKARQKIK